MKRIGFLLILTCLLVTGIFAGLYFFWHRQEMRAGKVATLEQLYGADEWTADFLAAEPKKRIAEVRKELQSQLAMAKTTLEKMERLVSHILNEVQTYAGIPAAGLGKLTGLEIYRDMVEGRASVNSDHLTRAYVGVANAVGIPTRLVQAGEQSFAESWVAEWDKWAFVDISSRKAYVVDGTGIPLDAVELLVALREGIDEWMEVALFQGGEITRAPCEAEQLHLSTTAVLCYPRAQHLYGSAIRRKGYELFSPKLLYAFDHSVTVG